MDWMRTVFLLILMVAVQMALTKAIIQELEMEETLKEMKEILEETLEEMEETLMKIWTNLALKMKNLTVLFASASRKKDVLTIVRHLSFRILFLSVTAST